MKQFFSIEWNLSLGGHECAGDRSAEKAQANSPEL